MADKTTTKFPKMGNDASVVNNVSGAPSSNTHPIVKSGNAKGGSQEQATASIRSHVLERNGFKGAPQMNHVYAQAPEVANTGRNVRIVQSAVGNRDFYNKRQYGQVAQ